MEQTQRNERLAMLAEPLLAWYDKNKRILPWRENTDPYRVWVSEIMLQQTRVEAAKEHYIRFIRELPTVGSLAACAEEKLLKLWEGLGYYSRAKNMQKTARIVAAQDGFPTEAEELKKLSGIGDYTAGAIASISFGKPAPAVDGNVVRVLSRVLGDAENQEILRKRYAEELAPAYPRERCGDFTQSLMELGALVCVPATPRCLLCPLCSLCETRSDALPAKRTKPEKKESEMTIFVFFDEEGLWLCRRESGVLAGMTQFYNTEGTLDTKQASDFLCARGLTDFSLKKGKEHKHVFTHLIWHMRAFPVYTREDVGALPAFSSLRFYTYAQAEREVSLPSAFRWCVALADVRQTKN